MLRRTARFGISKINFFRVFSKNYKPRGRRLFSEPASLQMTDQFDDKLTEAKTIKALTTKEIKKLIRPQFEADPDTYYPTKFLRSVGFERSLCPISGHYYWSLGGSAPNCGDSEVVGQYSFIGEKSGIGQEAHQSLASVWEAYRESFTTARIPSTAIDRYPVVARWRNDVDFVLAGIFCFQPYCVTGELDPPANPLICPQFCARFNDLDNIGLTGRHYSGFIMLGNQVFNKPDNFVYFKEESVEFNYNFLTKGLKIDPADITFTEDIWAGGGNLGPCMEYFIKGMEIGNMVFMEFKTFPDGSIEKLPITVIDTGIGLERIPWLLNGSPTSYSDTFPKAYKFLVEKLDMTMNNEIWNKVGPLSCRLDVDEAENLDKTWAEIAELVGEDLATIQKSVEPIRDVFIILDHTRTIMMLITDGALPSNIGGGSNLRNVLRRTFAIMKKNNWINHNDLENSVIVFEDYLEIFAKHQLDLEGLYGAFKDYKSFNGIIRMEYERWMTTDDKNKDRLKKLLKKKKNKLNIDDWILCITTYGIPPEAVEEASGVPVPKNLYHEIATRQEMIAIAAETVLYDTAHYPATLNLYYDNHRQMVFDGKVVAVLNNVTDNMRRNIVILDQSAFYPTSGGQQHDTGVMSIGQEQYQVVNVEKVGHCVLHILDRDITLEEDQIVGASVSAEVDQDRRNQLMCHHTATHIVFAACRRTLGPHVWQHGAKKTIKQAHLDITHFSSLTKEQILEIQNEANRIILSSKNIDKSLINKADAEREHGFLLYQGGVVPGNELRVVKIEDTDVEACCGTHCDNTSEVGWVKVLTAKRIADGIVRLYFVAGQRVIEVLNDETKVINSLNTLWGINQENILATANKFFAENKIFKTAVTKQTKSIINLQISYTVDVPSIKKSVFLSTEPNATIYFSYLEPRAKDIVEAGKAIVYVGGNFVIGIAAEESLLDFEALQQSFVMPELPQEEMDEGAKPKKAGKLVKRNKVGKKKNVIKCCMFNYISPLDSQKVIAALEAQEFTKVDL